MQVGIAKELSNSIVVNCINKGEMLTSSNICWLSRDIKNNCFIENTHNEGSGSCICKIAYSISNSTLSNVFNIGKKISAYSSPSEYELADTISSSTLYNVYTTNKNNNPQDYKYANNITNSNFINCYQIDNRGNSVEFSQEKINYEENTDENIILLRTINDWKTIANNVNNGIDSYEGKTIVLMNDLDFNNVDTNFICIGKTNSFKGTFDGNGYVIKNITSSTQNGLFGKVENSTIKNIISLDNNFKRTNAQFCGLIQEGYNSTIKNIAVKGNSDITGEINCEGYGAVIGYAKDSVITNCANERNYVSISGSVSNIAGIVGKGNNIQISNCRNEGALTVIQGNGYLAGIVGTMSNGGIIESCYNTGSLTSQAGYYVAGIVSGNLDGGIVKYCFNTGDMQSNYGSNGIGYTAIPSNNQKGSKIISCYNSGDIKCSAPANGIFHQANYATVTNCYNFGNAECNAPSAGIGYRTEYSKVMNCYNFGNVGGNDSTTISLWGSGILSNAKQTVIERCTNYGKINSSNYSSGILYSADSNDSCTIINCSNNGEIYVKDSNAFCTGIIGQGEKSIIERCFNNGSIGNSKYNSGIAGTMRNGKVIQCYNLGTFSTGNIGGCVYSSSGCAVNHCYNLADINGVSVGGILFVGSANLTNSCNYGNLGYGGVGGIAYENNWRTIKCNNYGKINSGGGAGIVYNSSNSLVIDCHNFNSLKCSIIGGIVYSSGSSQIIDCSNEGDLEAGIVAGILYQSNGGNKIYNCYNSGNIESNGVGAGIVYNTNSNDYIVNCYNEGNIHSYGSSSGIGGINIENCYNKGLLSVDYIYSNGNKNVYGITSTTNANAKNCYYLDTSVPEGQYNKQDVVGQCESITEEQLQSTSFVKKLNNNRSKYTTTIGILAPWKYNENSNPTLETNRLRANPATVVNKHKAELVITKVDADNPEKKLAGAEFKIEQANKDATDLLTNGNVNKGSYSYQFIKNGNVYQSNNAGQNNQAAASYITIDLTDTKDMCELTVNASISSEANNDIGYAWVTETTSTPSYYITGGRFIYISGEVQATDYKVNLKGGKIYYLHLGYYKNGSVNSGNDKFTINSVKLKRPYKDYMNVTTNNSGIATVPIPDTEKLRITEIIAPKGYELVDYVQEIETIDENINLTVKNEKENTAASFTINKTDENGNPLKDAKFEIYRINGNGEKIDFAKARNGQYAGTLENEKYIFKTDEQGKIVVVLQEGLYKAVEVEAPEGYALESDEELRSIYFEIEDEVKLPDFSGTEILISTPSDLQTIANNVNSGLDDYKGKTLRLANNIDMSGYTIKIGDTNVFRGNFDGNNNTISNLNKYLFGIVEGSEIGNVTLDSPKFNATRGMDEVSFIGSAYKSNLYNIKITGTGYGFGSGPGGRTDKNAGIVGYVEDSIVNSCSNSVSVSASYGNSGSALVYTAQNSKIINCNNAGTLSNGPGGTLSGIVYNAYNSKIINCKNTGSKVASSAPNPQGIVINANNATIKKCYDNDVDVSGKVYTLFGTQLDIKEKNVVNKKYRKLTINKIDEDTNEPISGAEFDILVNISNISAYSGTDQLELYKNITIGEDGSAIIEITKDDTYTLIEKKAPNGYMLEEHKEVITPGNEDVQLTVSNKKETNPHTFTINKTDENGNALSGAKFEIYKVKVNGETIDFAKNRSGRYVGENENNKYRVTTDYTGKVSVTLEDGLYKAVEVEAPEGYSIKDADEIYFKVPNEEIENIDLEINKIEDLVKLSNEVNSGNNYDGKYVKLMNSLNFNEDSSYENPNDTSFGDYNGDGTTEGIKEELTKTSQGCGFIPIGGKNSGPDGKLYSFSGTFDGNNKEINGLYINNTSMDVVGLFGIIRGATIKNLKVSGNVVVNCVNIGQIDVAGIVGFAGNESKIINCENSANITVTNNNSILAGGINGSMSSSCISNCNNKGNISITTSSQDCYAGGISGYNWTSFIENCSNEGSVSATSSNSGYWTIVGGVLGYSDANSYVDKAFNKGNVTASSKGNTVAGGIVGCDYSPCRGINNACNIGEVSVNSTGSYSKYIGGILGYANTNNPVKNSVNLGKLRSLDTVYSYIGGIIGYASTNVNVENVASRTEIEAQSASKGGLVGSANNSSTFINAYHNYTRGNGNSSFDYGYSLTDEQIKSVEFLKLFNTETNGMIWIHNEDNYPIIDLSSVKDRLNADETIANVTNYGKVYKITTKVEKGSDGLANGGNISGRDLFAYEIVDHAQNSNKPIVITPYEGYVIDKITINGEKISFNTDENGNYTLPQFTEMNENKEVAVTFIKDNKYNFILNKTNGNNEKLQGVKFCIYDEEGNFAKDYSGNYVGVKETIEGEERYAVSTDKDGQIKLKLKKGKYKIVEVETLEGYLLDTEEREFDNNDESVRLNWQAGFVYTHNPSNQYIYPTNDGGMIEVFGSYNSTIPADKTSDNQPKQLTSDKGVMLKYNNQGKIEKVVQFPGLEWGTIVYQDSDNNYVVWGYGKQLEIPAGSTVDNRAITLPYSGTSIRTIILKLDSNLKVIYAKAIESFYPTTSSNYMNENKAGNYIINITGYGTTNSNGDITIPAEMTVDNQQIQFTRNANSMLVEMTKEGKIKNVTQFNYGTSSFVENSDGGYLIATGYSSPIAVKLDSNFNVGETLTNNTGLNVNSSYATQDGGIIVTAAINSNVVITGDKTASGEDIEINSSDLPNVAFIKYNKDFKIEWVKVKSFDSSGLNEYAYYIKQDLQGNYYALINNYKLIKFDSEMNISEVIEVNNSSNFYPSSNFSHFVLYDYLNGRWEDSSFGSNITTPTIMSVINHQKSQIIVHHYKKGTGPEFGNEPIQVADDEISVNALGNSYTTAPKTDIEGYKLVTDDLGDDMIPENAEGQYTLEVQEIFYYYEEVDKHKITAQVEVPEGRTEKGGKITGDITINPDSVIEELEYNKTSTKDILIEPDTGYRVKEIRLISTDSKENKNETVIYGEDSDVTAEVKARMMKNGKMILTKFTNVKEDKHIIVVFEPNEGTVLVHHYIENTTEKLSRDEITTDLIGTVVETNPVNKERYVLVSGPEGEERIPTIDNTLQQRTYYYQLEHHIITDVIEHDELYVDKDSEGNITERNETEIKGGNISGEDEEPYEAVIRYRDNTKKIEVTPSDGYEIISVTINDEVYDYKGIAETNDKVTFDENGKLTLDEAFFTSMEEDKDIKVSFKKKSKVIVKYLEEETGKVLYKTPDNKDFIEITGVEGDDFSTEHKIIPGYKDSTLGITDEDGIDISDYSRVQIESNSAKGNMYANEITIIYWYKRIESKAIERHIEINEKGEATELANREFNGFALDTKTTSRMNFGDDYISVDGPENSSQTVTVVGKDEDSKEVTLAEEGTNEVWYYYEKQFKVTTEVKPHIEKDVDGNDVEVDGGTISKEYKTDENGELILDEHDEKIEIPYEIILNRGDSTKEIVIKPDDLYRIKSITINDIAINLDNFTKAEDGSITLPEKYFEDVREDKHVVVEFEKIPAKVIVKYLDSSTGEELLEDKIIEGYINDSYNEQRVEVEGYIPDGPEPDNNVGNMTEDTITVIYYYTKEFIITTDVKEHEEYEGKSVIDILTKSMKEIAGQDVDDNDIEGSDSENDDKLNELRPKVQVKGGSITGELTPENEDPVEVVNKGKDNEKEIVIKPDENYRVKSITVYEGDKNENGEYTGRVYEIDIDELIEIKKSAEYTETDEKDNTIIIPAKYFTNMQSDKHIVVEFEKIPSKVIVNYKEKATEKDVAEQLIGIGTIGDEYITHEQEIPYYELLKDELPENAEGVMVEEDTIVTYWYRRFLFNMKLDKEFSSIQINGKEVLGDNNEFARVEIKNTELNKTNITVKYKVTVTNTEEIAGTAKVIEQIPVGFKFVNSEDDGWVVSENSELNVDNGVENGDKSANNLAVKGDASRRFELTTRELQPGESAEYEVVLEWDRNAKIIGNLDNIARIVSTENGAGFDEETLEDNQDSCMLVVSIKTGQDRKWNKIISIACFVLAGVCTVAYVGSEVYYRKKNS